MVYSSFARNIGSRSSGTWSSCAWTSWNARCRQGRAEFERRLVLTHRLLRSAHGDRLVAGSDAGLVCSGQVVRLAGVARELGGGAVDRLGKRHRIRSVQPNPLARQQVVVHGLGEQGMPEPVIRLAARLEDVRVDGLVQGRVQDPVGHVGDLGQQRVRDAPAGDCGHPDHVPGVVGEPIEADEQQVGELGGQHVGAGAVDRRRDELLGEESVALGAVDDPADLRLGHRLGVQRPDELAHLVLIQWRQVQALDTRQTSPFGNGPA